MTQMLFRPTPIRVTLALAIVLIVGSLWIPDFLQSQASNWIIFGLLGASLVFVWGKAGIFSFGQGAFFGIGGYVYGIASINLVATTNETFSAVVLAVIGAAFAAGLLGYFMFYGKVGDVYVGVVTLASTLVLFTFMSSTASPVYHVGDALLGGYNGMAGVPPLTLGWPGGPSEALTIWQTLAVVIALAALVLCVLYALLSRPFGYIVSALRENEQRTQLLGYDVRLRKLLVFMIGGAVAGLAGALYAAWSMFMSPTVFGLQQAALVVIWVLVGGRASIAGAFCGVVFVEGLSAVLGSGGGNATPIVLGVVLILVVLLLPQGVVPAVQARLKPRTRTRAHAIADDAPEAELSSDTVAETLPPGLPVGRSISGKLSVTGLHKRFGGLRAVNDVSISFAERGVHCLIGPNGAGKSTFFNLLAGRFPPTSGQIMFAGRDMTHAEPHTRARAGMGIKLQIASIFPGLSVHENMWLSAYAKLHSRTEAEARASAITDWLGLGAQRHTLAGELSHGQKQWLEIGMVTATEPSIVLLDEPTAGMTRTETTRTAQLVSALGSHVNVIVVEHDMEFVRQLDVPVTIFHQGSVFASGTLEDLQRDERVLNIYLGRHGAHGA
ncbi:ATP-binding cassette domain-containing protein [Pararobbsia alpina]|uniref:Vitamin B12 import ATP-binding protein BtuD n=1 Tax=Pararobbsia alpina TaxID=621374 RepID=A0A6S7BBL0_9BURK|nr:ATP-binding cassette domain-containing protein [Pararobbsia alpina]CAB3794553.1 Vitamin B12 import ATP-binding protein BtuD [Pararobbsia alpina]